MIKWLAGLLEGEGCFTARGKYPSVILKMKDHDVVKRAATLMKARTYKDNRGMLIATTSTAKNVYTLCAAVLPYMFSRRTQRIKEIMELASKIIVDEANRKQKQILIRSLWETGKFENKYQLSKAVNVHANFVYNWTT